MAALPLRSACLITSYICCSRNLMASHIKFSVADVTPVLLCIVLKWLAAKFTA